MPIRQVQLVKDAKEQARKFGVPVGLLQDDGAYDRGVSTSGVAYVDNRDFHLLTAHGLIQDGRSQLDSPAADQPEAEAAADTSRTRTRKRGPHGTAAQSFPGGSGHQPGEGHGHGPGEVPGLPLPPAKTKKGA